MTTLKLFDSQTITHLDWPDNPDADYARRYLLPLLQADSQTYIANVRTKLYMLQVDDIFLPLTVTAYHPDNSYVCSPYNHYFGYGQEELVRLENPPLERFFRLLLWPLAAYFRRSGFDRVVMVNNWLLSTNLYPALQPSQMQAVIPFLIDCFPDRAILFRSVDRFGNRELYQTLLNADCDMIFSRQIYYQQPEQARRKKQFKVDLTHLRRTPYTVVEGRALSAADVPRVVELYNKLYLEKYSYYNPQFTEKFIDLALKQQTLTLKSLVLDGQIDGVLGYFTRRGLMTCPLFGYDTALPQDRRLYVLLSVLASLEGLQHDWTLHLSAGVGPFKRLRGGLPALEYNVVYHGHLPTWRKAPWHLLKGLMDTIAVPIIQRYGF